MVSSFCRSHFDKDLFLAFDPMLESLEQMLKGRECHFDVRRSFIQCSHYCVMLWLVFWWLNNVTVIIYMNFHHQQN